MQTPNIALETSILGIGPNAEGTIAENFKKIDAAFEGGAPGGDGEAEPITGDDITDATTVGLSLLRAETQALARAAIGAGTSSLTLGSKGTTAAAGNHTHSGYATTAQYNALEARVAALEAAAP